MIRISKRAAIANLLISVFLVLLLIAVYFFIIRDSVGSVIDSQNSCTGLAGDALWLEAPCDSSVSYEYPKAEREEYGGQSYACCHPIPGRRSAFERKYGEERSEGLNFIEQQTQDADVAVPSENTGIEQTAPLNSEVEFFVNAREITQAISHEYSDELPPNAVVKRNSNNLFRAEHTFTDGEFCTLELKPTRLVGDTMEFSINPEPQFVFSTESENCEELLTLPIKPIRTLDGTEYEEPGWYKLEFIQWNSAAKNAKEQVANAYILVSDQVAPAMENNPGSIDSILSEETIRSRNNINTCLFAPYMASDESLPDVKRYAATDEVNQPSEFSNSFSVVQGGGFFTLRPSGSDSYHPYMHLFFADSGSSAVKTFGVTACNYVDVMDFQTFDGNYDGQKTSCQEFEKDECRDPYERPQIIDQELQNCFWQPWSIFSGNDGPLFSGTCESCNQITQCDQYNDEESCNVNQCFGRAGMNQRCFWEDECQQCNDNSPCSQYTEQETCVQDSCGFQERLGTSCQWVSGSCQAS